MIMMITTEDNESTNIDSAVTTIQDPMDLFLSKRYANLNLLTTNQQSTEGSIQNYSFLEKIRINPEIAFESCLVRSIFSGVAGFGLGGLMGGFFHTMQPIDSALLESQLSVWQQVKGAYRGIGDSCKRSAKGFAKVGAVYSAVECLIERERATHDINNSIYAGCVTGALLAYKTGPQGMAFGCAGFAAFSAIMEKLLDR